jgi:hypothetical protein
MLLNFPILKRRCMIVYYLTNINIGLSFIVAGYFSSRLLLNHEVSIVFLRLEINISIIILTALVSVIVSFHIHQHLKEDQKQNR